MPPPSVHLDRNGFLVQPEEKYIHEIRRLRRELEQANEKILTLTSQLTANVSLVYNLQIRYTHTQANEQTDRFVNDLVDIDEIEIRFDYD